jgi:hypothetical protein
MPILTLQRRQTEVGRIRIGEKKGNRPAKLDRFRITSASKRLVDEVAALYGGTVRQWDGSPAGTQWEVYTEARSLPVVVPPQNYLTQWYEQWSGGGCMRRCDGQTETRSGKPCLCPADLEERRQQAQSGKACKPTTRLNLMLLEVPSIGLWRLESHGENAAVELPGVAEVLALRSAYQEGVLELQQRRSVVQKPGGGSETRQYIVPYLDIHRRPDEMVALDGQPAGGRAAVAGRQEHAAIGSAPTAAPVEQLGAAAADWRARVSALADEQSWRALWAEFTNGGELADEVRAAMLARASEIKAGQTSMGADAGEPVDAEVVDEDTDQLWTEVMRAVPDGWSTSRTEQECRTVTGRSPEDATAADLRQFLKALKELAA